MEIKLLTSSLGMAIPKISMGFNLFSGVYIQLRNSPTDKSYVLGIASTPEIGGNSGTIVLSHINTAWMKVDEKKHPWLCDKMSLVGKKADIEIKNTLVFSGTVDVSITIYDEKGETKFSLSKVDVESSGGQLSNTKIRGKIVDMMGKTQHGRTLCGQP